METESQLLHIHSGAASPIRVVLIQSSSCSADKLNLSMH